MAKPLYVLLKHNSNPILWEEPDDTDFKDLKESLKNPPALRHPNDQIPFLYMKKKGMPLGYSPQNMETTVDL